MIDQTRLLTGERGEPRVAELAGVAVGFDDQGQIHVVTSGLGQLGPRQIRELEAELGTLLVALARGQRTPLQ